MQTLKEIQKRYREKNKDIIRERRKLDYFKNRDLILSKVKKYREENIDKLRERARENYRRNHKNWREATKQYHDKNSEKIKQYNKEWSKQNRERVNNWRNEKRKNDINYKILCNLRGRIHAVLKKNKKYGKTIKLLGCTLGDFIKYLESKFLPGMTWENYGAWKIYKKMTWHVDHIIPCDAFDLCNSEEQKTCFNWKNLQPLWALENLSKNAKTDYINYQI